jgi:hypothetical protein
MMEDAENPYIKESHIGMSIRGFIELLQAHWYPKRIGSSYKKTGPFSWEEPYGKNGVRALYLGRISKQSRDSRMCKIFEHICWHPTLRIVLPWRSRHVMTLHMTRIEGEPLYVQLVCRDPRVKDTMFKHFAAELDKLEEQYAKSGQGMARMPTQPVEDEGLGPGHGTGLSQDKESRMVDPEVSSPAEDAWNKIPDLGWDRQALELWWRGYQIPQIADRLHLTEKTVRNRMSALRKIYTEDIVPTAEQLRQMGLR